MLDNTMNIITKSTAETITPTMAARVLPTHVATELHAEQQQQQQIVENHIDLNKNTPITTTPNTTPTNKAKTILNWLKSATTPTHIQQTTTNIANINNNNRFSANLSNGTRELIINEKANDIDVVIVETKNCTCENARATVNKRADGTLRDFRGVQTLRNLWNKRISSACEENSKALSQSRLKKFNKSVSCLVNATKNAHDSKFNDFVKSQTKRAHSLHDCTQLDDFQDVSLEPEIDFLHREKDNFYKYKTAEQQHLAREAKIRAKTRRGSGGNGSVNMVEDAHFPAVRGTEKGERIHWLKRQDIMGKRIVPKKATNEVIISAKSSAAKLLSATNDVISTTTSSIGDECDNGVNGAKDVNACQQMNNNSTVDGNDDALDEKSGELSSDTADTLTAANSPQHNVSLRRKTLNETTLKNCASITSSSSASGSKRGSNDSLTASTASLATSQTRARRTGSNSSGATRKYSFKTHAKTYHHTPRKMIISNNNGNSSSNNNKDSGSMVAKLTQQFNDIIQKDKKLLEEVKRNNGVWLSRGAHVYKVVENPQVNKSPNVSRRNSRVNDTSTVQRAIKKFETAVVVVANENEKPEVPVKNLNVIQTHKELVSTSTRPIHLALSSNGRGKARHNLTLINQSLNNHADTQQSSTTSTSVKKLEMVREEAKTPLENELKTLLHATTGVSEAIEIGNPQIVQNVNQAESAANSHDPIATAATTSASNTVENHSNEELAITTIAKEEEISNNHFSNLNTIHDDVVDANAAATADVDADVVNDEKVKQRKHKYAKIYEKFRFRSPFSSSNGQSKKSNSAISSSLNKETELAQTAITTTSTDVVTAAAATAIESTENHCKIDAEAKILDALEVIDQKLKVLTVHDDIDKAVIIASADTPDDDFEQRLLPNSSFVFQATNSNQSITQAVNVALVNAIEGEQMIMEQKELQQRELQLIAEKSATTAAEKVEATDESMYEPIASINEPLIAAILQKPQSFLYKQQKSLNQQLHHIPTATEVEEDIYQTLEEARSAFTTISQIDATANKTSANWLADYESIAGSCEHTTPATKPLFDGYESYEPEVIEQQPSSTTAPTMPNTIIVVRNTRDELPELPKPKRRLPKSPMPGKRPLKTIITTPTITSQQLTATIDTTPTSTPTATLRLDSTAEVVGAVVDDDHHYYADDDDENIYDTIKGSHCYEPMQKADNSSGSSIATRTCTDTISLTSNCYESITQYRRGTVGSANSHRCVQLTGSSNGSTLTISSDHKTNSLYEVSLAAGLLYGGGHGVIGCRSSVGGSSSSTACGGSGGGIGNGVVSGTGVLRASCRHSVGDIKSNLYTYSHAASSDNSDDWVDMSDAEAEENAKQQFIVIKSERPKPHRSPVWSKRIRDKRLQQKKANSCIEDDSDHYYETLSPLSNKRHSTQLVQRSNSQLKRNQDLPRYARGGATTRASQRSKKFSASAHALGAHTISDDYDSFDTDTDEHYDNEDHQKNHNDSGVDIRNHRLPEPPAQSTNQVYAIVRKFKNFISNKKSSNSKHTGSQQKLYDAGAQFYVESNIYENTLKGSKTKNKYAKKSQTNKEEGDYENTEFHTPPAKNQNDNKSLSSSEKNLISNADSNEAISPKTPTSSQPGTVRAKAKNCKSLRSRLRKTLVGSTFDNSKQQFATLSPTRSTFYIEDPSNNGSGELDSGFSEKASSGDIPVQPITQKDEPQKCSTVARKPKKESKSNNTQRRRTTIGIRPHEPPPPPPEDATATNNNRASQQQMTKTYWYAECGVFKQSPTRTSIGGNKIGNSGASWYAESGLYQTSGISVASSSGSSGVSTGNEGAMSDDMPHSMFLNEPLYQIYSAAKLESITRDLEELEGSTDGYEEIGLHNRTGNSLKRGKDDEKRKSCRPTALQLIEPKNGPSRTLWSEIPEVIHSCILPTMTPRERGLQEAKFEIITSEASYLKSLNLLRNHFVNNASLRDTNILSSRDRKALFAYILPVQECSERLLTELETCWQDNIMLLGLSKRIYDIAEKHFHVYIAFCEHQGRMDRTLRRLKDAKGSFQQNLELLESSPTCCGLNLHSFLMLPMQRITRLPLLIDAVCSKVAKNDDEYDTWNMTLAIMNKIVTQCNEAANRCEQAYEIERISRQLEFPTTIRALAIAPMGVPAQCFKPRFLVRMGELVHLIWRGEDAKLTFGKRFTKTAIYAFLFSDLLVLTKRKGEEQFTVFDYCPRSMLTMASGDSLPQLPTKDINQTGKNLILMTLLENHERKTVEYVLACRSVSEQTRWLEAMRPPEAETPGEKLYESWDCPQVIAKHSYDIKEPDALNLELGDVVNVMRKLPDGWYQGERLRDGLIGWFPGSYTEEINSAHVRARNLKQRYRLLTFTASYLESQKRK